MLVLCSNSQCRGNNTTASLYWLTFDGCDLSVSFISGSTGCSDTDADMWSFHMHSNYIDVTCCKGAPCRYAFVTNTEKSSTDRENSQKVLDGVIFLLAVQLITRIFVHNVYNTILS